MKGTPVRVRPARARTERRTITSQLAAYLDDRRGKNFSISDGMGSLTTAWRAGSRQTTTITGMPADATTVKYDDKGNKLQLPGSYTQLAGELALEMSEQLKGGLKIGGTAVIAGGKLDLRFSRGVPAAGTAVTVLRAQRLHGRFDQITVEGASEIEVEYSAVAVVVRLKQVP